VSEDCRGENRGAREADAACVRIQSELKSWHTATHFAAPTQRVFPSLLTLALVKDRRWIASAAICLTLGGERGRNRIREQA